MARRTSTRRSPFAVFEHGTRIYAPSAAEGCYRLVTTDPDGVGGRRSSPARRADVLPMLRGVASDASCPGVAGVLVSIHSRASLLRRRIRLLIDRAVAGRARRAQGTRSHPRRLRCQGSCLQRSPPPAGR